MSVPALAPGSDRGRVLVVTDDKDARSALQNELSSFAELAFPAGIDALADEIPVFNPQLMILDLDVLGENARKIAKGLTTLREKYPFLPVLGLSRNRAVAARARFQGTVSLVAPVDPDVLIATVSAMLRGDAVDGLMPASSERRSLGQLIGSSESMQRVYETIVRLADSNTTVLIRGESGSGKELAARAIVSLGRRSSKPFISLNCGALPESLIESELFGHERGAFTGADQARPGQFELAHTGTLFLDEIATLTLSLQTKLLRVLEDREVRRIGGKTGRNIDFRLITATNEDLEEMVKIGRFREDLYYRINVVPVDMPPLRDREGDIPLLVDHYTKHFCSTEGIELKRFDPEALDILEDYKWPGNVRELENLMQRLMLMVPAAVIEAHHLPKNVLYASTAHHESLLIPEAGIDFEQEMERIEAAYLRAALRRTDGVKKEAGKLLKLTPRQMKYLCQKHGL